MRKDFFSETTRSAFSNSEGAGRVNLDLMSCFPEVLQTSQLQLKLDGMQLLSVFEKQTF